MKLLSIKTFFLILVLLLVVLTGVLVTILPAPAISESVSKSVETIPVQPTAVAAGAATDNTTTNHSNTQTESPTQESKELGNKDNFVNVWESLTPKLEQVLNLEENHDELSEHSLWGNDKASNRRDINEILNETINILALPSGIDYRQRIHDIEKSIREQQNQIADYRQSRISAPKEAMWRRTAADYEELIRESEERISGLRQRTLVVKQEFATELRELGLFISDEQLDFLLSTVIGDDLVAMSLAFDNVKAVTEQLEQLLVESGEDLLTAKRYYGMYTVLLTALEQMHADLLFTIERYLKQLDSIVEKTRTLMAQSRALKNKDARHQQTLKANIEAQKLTLRTAKIYRSYLLEQAYDVTSSRKQLTHDLAVARNTYETVKVSGELIAMVRSGQQMLDILFSRDMPTMFTFQNLEMQREFEKLTIQLRESEEK